MNNKLFILVIVILSVFLFLGVLSSDALAAESTDGKWVLDDTRINPNYELENLKGNSSLDWWYPESRYEGKTLDFTVEETSFVKDDNHKDAQAQNREYHYVYTAKFTKPPETLVEGKTIYLGASVTGNGPSHLFGFEYRINGVPLKGSTTAVNSKTNASFIVPKPSEGDKLVISARASNCDPCRVEWVYVAKLGTVEDDFEDEFFDKCSDRTEPGALIGHVGAVSGDVKVISAGEEEWDWVPPYKGMPIFEGDRIETGPQRFDIIRIDLFNQDVREGTQLYVESPKWDARGRSAPPDRFRVPDKENLQRFIERLEQMTREAEEEGEEAWYGNIKEGFSGPEKIDFVERYYVAVKDNGASYTFRKNTVVCIDEYTIDRERSLVTRLINGGVWMVNSIKGDDVIIQVGWISGDMARYETWTVKSKGTDLILINDPGTKTSGLYLYEGEANVYEQETGDSVDLISGQKLIITEGGLGEIQPLSQNEWDRLLEEFVIDPDEAVELLGPEIVFESRSKASGSSVQIPLTLYGVQDNIGNMDMTLRYDPSVLEATEVIKGGLTSDSLFDYNIIDETIRISLADKDGFSGDGSVAYVRFDVIGTEGSSSTLDIISLSANRAEDMATLNIPDKDGIFKVIGPGEGIGDNDGDGVLTALDALAALQMAVGKIPEDLTMDMNGDGSVTSIDARQILRSSAKLT